MAAPNRNPNLSPWQWGLIGAGSILMAVVSVFGLWHVMARSPDVNIAKPSEQPNSSSKRILGTWETGDKQRLIFTPEGKVHFGFDGLTFITFQYRLNTSQPYNRIDLIQNELGLTYLGTFKFDDDGKLSLKINEPVQTPFSKPSIVLKKVSERTTPDPQISMEESIQRSIKAKQSEARSYTTTLNKGQQAFFIEKNRFSSSVEDLGIGIKTETDNYSYKVRVFDDKRVQIMGIAKKDDLKSYTGAVFVLRVRNTLDVGTIAILCESDHSTKDTPPIPTASSEYIDAKLSCPSGYTQVVR
jgi:hypothetical protein